MPLPNKDDVWGGGNDVDGGPSEINVHWKADTGFSDADTSAMTAAYRWVADRTYATLLDRGKFVWNQVRPDPCLSLPLHFDQDNINTPVSVNTCHSS